MHWTLKQCNRYLKSLANRILSSKALNIAIGWAGLSRTLDPYFNARIKS
jgi:hypothetical protein